jgi:hypothetical protein
MAETVGWLVKKPSAFVWKQYITVFKQSATGLRRIQSTHQAYAFNICCSERLHTRDKCLSASSVQMYRRISVKFCNLGTSMKICPETPNLVTIGQKHRLLYTFRSCRQHQFAVNVFLCNIQHFILLIHAAQYTQNALLHFHCNSGYTNASQCYVIRTLPVL